MQHIYSTIGMQSICRTVDMKYIYNTIDIHRFPHQCCLWLALGFFFPNCEAYCDESFDRLIDS